VNGARPQHNVSLSARQRGDECAPPLLHARVDTSIVVRVQLLSAAVPAIISSHGNLFRVEVTRSMRVFALCVFFLSILLIAPRVNKSLVGI
jgi:hypothetical protein